MPANTFFEDHTDVDAKTATSTLRKWGGLASFLMPVAFIAPAWIYLTGDLQRSTGPLVYTLADFLYGPVWAASLVMMVFATREHIGERASHRMTLALLVALAAAGAFLAVACIRSANRHYHLIHPELHLEDSVTVLIVWTNLVAGIIGAAWHFLGWVLMLIGSAAWTSRRLPRLLSALYLLTGTIALFMYMLPDIEGGLVVLVMVVSIWQGILLWRTTPGEMPI